MQYIREEMPQIAIIINIGICLLTVAGKVYETILERRIGQEIKGTLQENYARFRPGQSTPY